LEITTSFDSEINHSWSTISKIVGVFLKPVTGKKLVSSTIARVIAARTLQDQDYRRSLCTFPFVDFITSNTKAGLKKFHAPKRKSLCIYNGFNFDRSKNLLKGEILRQQHRLENKFIVGMVASFTNRKDQGTVITAA